LCSTIKNSNSARELLPLGREAGTTIRARFNDNFSSLDLRFSKVFRFGEKARLEPIVEVFKLFNVTNILGVSNVNYSGFSNVLTRDSNNPGDPGFLRSSGFGRPVTTAGVVFGSGGPRAFQIAAKFSFLRSDSLRSHNRLGIQSGCRRAGPRGQPRIERRDEI
jgi:hypothetical protein